MQKEVFAVFAKEIPYYFNRVKKSPNHQTVIICVCGACDPYRGGGHHCKTPDFKTRPCAAFISPSGNPGAWPPSAWPPCPSRRGHRCRPPLLFMDFSFQPKHKLATGLAAGWYQMAPGRSDVILDLELLGLRVWGSGLGFVWGSGSANSRNFGFKF